MVNLTSFLPRLLPNVMGCSEPLALQALLDSAIDFCGNSLAVVQTLDPITVPSGTASFELDVPAQTSVAQVMNVWFDGMLIGPQPQFQATDVAGTNGTPRYYYGEEIDEAYSLTFMPAPDVTVSNGTVVRVALKPTRNATTVPTVLFERYVDAIVAGAQAILHGTQDQPYSNEQKALFMARVARSKTSAARVDALHGRVVSSMSVQMRAF